MFPKRKFILCLAPALGAVSVFAMSTAVHLRPYLYLRPGCDLPVSVQVADVRAAGEDFGRRFTVFLKYVGTDWEESILAQVDLSTDDDKQIASFPLEKKWATNGVQFQFTVSQAYLRSSKFSASIFDHVGKGSPVFRGFTSYWFYLGEFGTNHPPCSPVNLLDQGA